jgi:hypothetical protein
MFTRVSGIPVLNYHGIGTLGIPDDVPDRKYWITAATFSSAARPDALFGPPGRAAARALGDARLHTREADAPS